MAFLLLHNYTDFIKKNKNAKDNSFFEKKIDNILPKVLDETLKVDSLTDFLFEHL